MAQKDTSIKYKNCKYDPESGILVEYAKEGIYEHRIEDVFKDYHFEQNENTFDLTIKESKGILPENDELTLDHE